MQENATAKNQEAQLYRRPYFWFIAIILAIILMALIRNYVIANHKHPTPSQPVVVATVRSQDVPVYLAALGTVTPTNNVTIRTQINGQLLQVLFREGQTVKAGDLLAQIDSRPYEAQLTQYQGQLARDMALLNNARLDLKRYEKLWHQDSVAKQTLDTQKALVKQYEGTVQNDEGLIAATKLKLTYCRITSPIDGRVGLRQIDPGNFVQTSDPNGIVVINTLNPITVIFTLPQDQIAQVMQPLNAGKTLLVKAYDRNQTKLLATGTLLSVDNQMDTGTGTVKLKAQFANNDNRLFPSQFVNVQLWVDTLFKAIVVPTAAIQHGVQGTFVYLVNSNNTVSIKPVTIGVTFGDNTTVTGAITPGQQVVTEGEDKLTEGALVTLPPTDSKQTSPITNSNGETQTRVAA